jgi:Holliday junction resolvase RusA-like endonuclease
MVLYEAMIPLNPRTKKNNQQILINGKTGKPFVAQNAKYKLYEQDARWFLRKPSKPISQPVNIKCIFYRDSDRRCDLTNLLEAIDDILVKYGIIEDDNFHIIYSHDGSRVFVDRKNPRTEIVIEDIFEI